MSAYIAGFGAWLLVAAYTPGTVRNMLKDACHLGRWMERADIEAAQLDWDLVQAFRRARSAQDARRVPGVRAFRPLMEYLEAEGVIAPAMFPSTPVSESWRAITPGWPGEGWPLRPSFVTRTSPVGSCKNATTGLAQSSWRTSPART